MSETIQIPKGWELRKLSDVLDVLSGYAFKSAFFSKTEGKPLIRIRDLEKKQTAVFYTKDDYDEKFIVNEGDYLISMDGDFKIFEWKGPEGLLNQRVCKLHNFSEQKVSPKFILYAIQDYLQKIHQNTTFTTVKHISSLQINAIELPFPSLLTQKKIVKKLDGILGQLEEKKKAVFSIIEQNKEKIDFFEKNFLSEIMKKHLKIGNYPKTWNVKTIGELTNRIGGGTPSKSNEKYYQGNICWITISDLSDEITFPKIINDSKMKITEQAINESSTKIIPKDSVVLGTRVGVGKLGIAGEKITTNQDFTSFVCSKELDPYFLACYFLANKQQLRMKSRGVSVKGITTSAVDSFRIGFPSIKEQKQIVQNIKNAEEKFKTQKIQFENIKENYENTINHINHLQPSILDVAFSGKLVQ